MRRRRTPSRRFAIACWLLPALLAGCLGRTQVKPAAQEAPAPPREVGARLLRSARVSGGIELTTTSGRLTITAPRPDTFRLRFAASESVQALPSFALAPDEVPAADGASAPAVEESEAMILVRTERAILRVDKQPFKLRLMDAAGSGSHRAGSTAGRKYQPAAARAAHVERVARLRL